MGREGGGEGRGVLGCLQYPTQPLGGLYVISGTNLAMRVFVQVGAHEMKRGVDRQKWAAAQSHHGTDAVRGCRSERVVVGVGGVHSSITVKTQVT